MRRKTLILLFIIALFVVSGCGPKDTANVTPEVQPASQPAATTPTAQAQTERDDSQHPATEQATPEASEADPFQPSSTLVQALERFRDIALEKLEHDVDSVAIVFTDVKSYWRAKRWADIFAVPLHAIEAVVGVVSSVQQLNKLPAVLTSAWNNARAAYEILAIAHTLNGASKDGEQLRTALDGASYLGSIEAMLEAADATSVPPLGYDEGYYKRTILGYLYGVSGSSPIRIPERSSTIDRDLVSTANGALPVRQSIEIALTDLVTEIQGIELPVDFPLEETIASVDSLSYQVLLSKSRSIEDLSYSVYLGSSSGDEIQDVTTSLGSVAGLYSVFGAVAGVLDEELEIQTRLEIVKAVNTAGKSLLSLSTIYDFGAVGEAVRVATSVASPTLLALDVGERLFYGDPESAYYSVPQEMILALPIELGTLWQLCHDVVHDIQFMAQPRETPTDQPESARGSVSWEFSYDTWDSPSIATDVTPLPDGDLVVTGCAFTGAIEEEATPTAELPRPWIMRLSALGDVKWATEFSTPAAFLVDALNTSDGGVIAVGAAGEYDEVNRDVWCVKLSSDGDVEWQLTCGAGGVEEGAKVLEAGDGSYLIGATSDIPRHHTPVFWLLKVSRRGELEWGAQFWSEEAVLWGGAFDICLGPDDSCFVTAKLYEASGSDRASLAVLRIDSRGSPLWQKALDVNVGPDVSLTDIVPIDDGGCLVAFTVLTGDFPKPSLRCMRLATDGSIAWEKAFLCGTWWLQPAALACMSLEDGRFNVHGLLDPGTPLGPDRDRIEQFVIEVSAVDGELLAWNGFSTEVQFLAFAGQSRGPSAFLAGALVARLPSTSDILASDIRPAILAVDVEHPDSTGCLRKEELPPLTVEASGNRMVTIELSPTVVDVTRSSASIEGTSVLVAGVPLCGAPPADEPQETDQGEACDAVRVRPIHELTRSNVAEFIAQHQDASKYWFHISLAWDSTSAQEIGAIFDDLRERRYIANYAQNRPLFDQLVEITTISPTGRCYMRGLSDGGVFGQGVDIALCEKANIRVTGIHADGAYAKVEYTWTCGRITPVFELLHPILTDYNFQLNLDTTLERVLELRTSGSIHGEAYFSLYDDGWRLEEVLDDVSTDW